jgi:hypothetical protein
MNYLSYVSFAQQIYQVEEVDGATVISNPKHPIPRNGLQKKIVFKEELSIGEIEGDENYMFGSWIYFNTDEEGNFYVADHDNKRIQKFNSQGEYLLTIGRKGQGPGEFEYLSGAQFDKEGNLYITDRINKRISFFNLNGKFLKQVIVQGELGNISINSKGFVIALSYEPFQESGGVKGIEKLVLFDKKFNPIKVIHQNTREAFVTITGGDINKIVKTVANSISKDEFRPILTYKLAKEDNIYFGYPEKYEINIFSPEGECRKIISRNYDPISVSRKDKAIVLKRYSENPYFIKRYPEQIRKKILNSVKFPKYKPAYQFFILMENGWLAVIVDSIENEYAIIDLFDAEGRYIAQFKTDVPVRNIFFKNGKAYAVAYEEDFPFVKRYAIELQEYKNGKWVKSNTKLY